MIKKLKFRAYDKLEKRYIKCDEGYQGHYILSLKGEFHNLQNGSGGNDYIVQQWTGLVDKNDVEIYEGDIVWLDYFGRRVDEKDHNQFEVIFDRGAFQLKPIKLSKPQGFGIGGGNFAFSHIAEIIGHDQDGAPVYQYHLPPPQPISQFNICVVMGNIFENNKQLEP